MAALGTKIAPMVKLFRSVFKSDKENYKATNLPASLEFGNGVIFGHIYKISEKGFVMFTPFSVADLPAKIAVLIKIQDQYLPATVLKVSKSAIVCEFIENLQPEKLTSLLSKKA